jgi:hypothetical protein
MSNKTEGKRLLALALATSLVLLNLPAAIGGPFAALLGTSSASAAIFNGGGGCFASPQKATLAVESTTVTPGTAASVIITGTGFQPFVQVNVFNNAAQPLAGNDEGSNQQTLNVASDGTFTTTFAAFPGFTAQTGLVTNTDYAIGAEDAGGNCATLTGITEGPGTTTPGGLPAGAAEIVGFSGTFTGTLTPSQSGTSQSIQVTFPISVAANQIFTATIDTNPNNNDTTTQGAPQTLLNFTPTGGTNGELAPGTALTINLPGTLSGQNVHSVVVTVPVSPTSIFTPTGTAVGAFGVRYVEPSPAVTISPASGPAFTNITLSGVGFGGSTSGTSDSVTITSTAFAAGSVASTSIPSPAVDISGTWTTTFPLTATTFANGGTIVITSTDLAGVSIGKSFVITPLTTTTTGASISLISTNPCPPASGSSASAVAGQSVPLVLSGFGASEQVNLSVAGATASVIGTTDANGNLVVASIPLTTSGLTRNIPANSISGDQGVSGATYTVSAIGLSSGKVATTFLTSCGSSLVAGPSTVNVGGSTTITGTGFAANSVVTLTDYLYNPLLITSTTSTGVVPANGSTNNGGTSTVYTSTTSAVGSFSTPITLPTSFGAYTVRAQDLSGIVATVPVTVGVASFTVTPTAVYPTQGFTLSAANGFQVGETVYVTPTNGTAVVTTTNASGGFSVPLVAPANSPNGALNITVSAATEGTSVVTETIAVPTATVTVATPVTSIGASVPVTGAGFIPSQPVTIDLTFTSGGVTLPVPSSAVTATVDASGAFSTTYTISPSVLVASGSYNLRATSSVAPQQQATAPITVSNAVVTGPSGNPSAPTAIYFAEGYTGRAATNGKADFNEFISVLNPDNFSKPVTFTYFIQGSSTPVVTTTMVPANSDILESVNTDVGPDKIVSALVSSPYRVAAERVINRVSATGATLDADSSLGSTNPSTTVYFAEGYTGASFQQYLTVMNPMSATASVTVTFLTQGAPVVPARVVSFTVPANSRYTENIRADYLAYSDKSEGMVVQSSSPIVAERVEYWGDGAGSGKYGADTQPGLTTAAKQWFFAYGSDTGAGTSNIASPAQLSNDESYVTIVNPSLVPGSDATVLVSFFDSTGKSINSVNLTVSPGSRETVVVNNALPGPVAGDFATVVNSDQPIMVEHPQYLGGSPNAGTNPGASPVGSPAGLQATYFPNVNTATAAGAPISETVFLYNPGNTPVTVQGTYYTPGGATVTKSYVVPVSSTGVGGILTINVNADAGGLPQGPLGAVYTTSSGSFVAARVANDPGQKSYIATQGVPGM